MIASAGLIVSVTSFLWMAYGLQRTAWSELLVCFGLAWLGAGLLFRSSAISKLRNLLLISLLFRLLFLVAVPELSDDYFRFVWDGRLMVAGESPFAQTPENTPETIARQIDPDGEFREGMNSNGYFSVYPPLHQLVFYVSAYLGSSLMGTLILMRLILIGCELLLITILFRLIQTMGRPKSVALYALNPLVIAEVSGNLHFEGLVALLVVLGAIALVRSKIRFSGLWMGIAAALKLTPFIFFPVALSYLSWKRGAGWALTSVLAFVLCGWWLIPVNQWSNLLESVALYFRSFEFNASVYYLARAVGETFLGYNPVATTGWLIPLIGALLILWISFVVPNRNPQQVFRKLAGVGAIYLIFATTVHPWYLIPLIALSVPAKLLFPIVWSAMVIFSYHAYGNFPYRENLWLVALQYAVVFGVATVELFGNRKPKRLISAIWGETP